MQLFDMWEGNSKEKSPSNKTFSTFGSLYQGKTTVAHGKIDLLLISDASSVSFFYELTRCTKCGFGVKRAIHCMGTQGIFNLASNMTHFNRIKS